MTTTIADALTRAGYESPRERVARLTRTALEGAHGDRAVAVVALAKSLLASDAATVWEFFALDRDTRLWQAVEAAARIARIARGEEEPTPIRKTREAASSPPERARSVAPPSSVGGQKADVRKDRLPGAAAPSPTLARISADSVLRTFLVNGQPLALTTGRQARAWALAQGRNAHFVGLMAEGVQDNQLIGDCKTDDDVAKCRKLAEARNVTF